MQDTDISLSELCKVLQEVEKDRRLKAIIRNQAKAKVKKTRKNSEKKYLNKEEKKAKKFFYKKSQTLQISRVPMPFKI